MKMATSRNRFLSAGLLAALLSVFTPACTDSGKQPGNQDSAAEGSAGEGTFFQHFGAEPTTLNPITSTDAYASTVQTYVLDSLLTRNEDTYEWQPALAESWEISKDGKTFTFKLREGVKWHDGKPLTAEDVKYSFDAYFDGRWEAPHMKVYLEGIEGVTVVDPRTVRFETKDIYFKNFDVAAGLAIIPKHIYAEGDSKDSKFNKMLIGTGPYRMQDWVKGQKITLKRNSEFWGDKVPYFKDRFNFRRLYFRPVKEEAVALELLKRGDIDFLGLTPEQYVQKTKGPEWGDKVIAVKAENSSPSNFNYGYIAWNGKHPFFGDARVRRAMSHLVNRDFMIEKFLFGMNEKATGPFGNSSPSSSPEVKPVEYNPKKALELLKEAGWKLGPNGLTKVIDGRETPFEFTLTTANPDFEKFLTVVKEDMKKVGIQMTLRYLEWNSFMKLVDERKFDAVNMAWSVGGLESDPKQIWHSASIPAPGHNFVSYSNPKVDQAIDQLRRTMDEKKRRKYYHIIHKEIARDQPYSFLFNRKYSLYAHTGRIQKPQDTFKYGLGVDTWKLKDGAR